MAWDLDEREFYDTFTELQESEGNQRALEWAWSALDWTQQELRKNRKSNGVDGEAYNMGRAEGQADVTASLRHILDPEDKNHWNLVGLLKEVVRLSGERAAVVAFLRACVTDAVRSEDDLDYALAVIERGAHRRKEKG